MYNSWFEETRYPLESIQNLEKAIVSEMLAQQDNPKEKSISDHRINNFLTMIQQKSKDLLTFFKEESATKKQELAVIQGKKSIKSSEKKKPEDVTWQNYYDRARQIKEYYKKKENNQKQDISQNSVQFFRRIVFQPPFKDPVFSLQQNKGKYVDMHSVYLNYLNLCRALLQKDGLRLHDYLWFLQNMDKFDDFTVSMKMKNHFKYLTYLKQINEYLLSFLRRSRPLYLIDEFLQNIETTFEIKYKEGNVHGWEDQQTETEDDSQLMFCDYCEKMFLNNAGYMAHLQGKPHQKNMKKKQNVDTESEEYKQKMAQKEIEAKNQLLKGRNERKKQLAFQQFKVSKLRQELADTIYDTMNLVRKKQTRGYQQVEQIIQQSSESEDADAPIYNPKNLPLGWDGKPIPYWLYKLHGLGIEYKCEICGNYSYWGRRAFQMHFQQWRHTYGMKCLKIPNTIHFKDVTTITDALALHQKLMRESQESQFRPDIEQEFEDNEGNILNKRTYTDMRKQGLIDN